jgi:aminopeptidase N
MFLIGQNQFSYALQSYFNRFEWSNATITDFLDDIQPYFPAQATGTNLTAWATAWLSTPSLNVF